VLSAAVAQAAPRSRLKVSASVGKKQRILRSRRVSLRIRCNNSCSIRVRATIKVRGRGKRSGGRKARVIRRTVRLRVVSHQIAGGKATVLKLRLSKQSRAALKHALGGRKRMRVIVRVTARDGSGASVSLKKGVRRRA